MKVIECESKVAVITGGNAGIGFALAQRLVRMHPYIRLCLACRNKERATKAAESLRQVCGTAIIDIVIIDTSSIQSVYKAATEIKKRYSHIDMLYFNAGMVAVAGVDWDYVLKSFCSTRCIEMFTTGEGALKHLDWVTDDGLQAVFQTNLFGHYVLLKELEPVIGCTAESNSVSQVIWTSSSAAQASKFDIDDIQHKNGNSPYSSSKYATDIVSVGINNRFNKQGIYSHTVCPGLVESNLTYGILPAWLWRLLTPLIILMRICVPSITTTPYNGSEALLWLSSQDPCTLDPQIKYQSSARLLGSAYVSKEKMKIAPEESDKLLRKLDELEQDVRKRYVKGEL